MSEIIEFNCIKCGAPLIMKEDGVTAECKSCGTAFLVPESYRPNNATEKGVLTKRNYEVVDNKHIILFTYNTIRKYTTKLRFIGGIGSIFPGSTTDTGLFGSGIGLEEGCYVISDNEEYILVSEDAKFILGTTRGKIKRDFTIQKERVREVGIDTLIKGFDWWSGVTVKIDMEDPRIILEEDIPWLKYLGKRKFFLVVDYKYTEKGLEDFDDLLRSREKDLQLLLSNDPIEYRINGFSEVGGTDTLRESVEEFGREEKTTIRSDKERSKTIKNTIIAVSVIVTIMIVVCIVGGIKSCNNGSRKSEDTQLEEIAIEVEIYEVMVGWGLPLRALPDGESELVLKLEKGARLKLLSESGDWIKVETADYPYVTGWVRRELNGEVLARKVEIP